MLETLISSRIRRTLFEYLLTHPTQYFYLRGLAKELNLSISPLRRELAKLEQSGVLTVVQEANIRFYRVNTESPVYRQLRQAFYSSPAAKPAMAVAPEPVQFAGTPSMPVAVESSQPAPAPAPTPRPRSPLQGPALVGAAVVGMALMLIMASLFYISMTTRTTDVTVITPPPASPSGVMRGNRWHLVPGGFGGFSAGASNESY